MINSNTLEQIFQQYEDLVKLRYPNHLSIWPVRETNLNIESGELLGWHVLILRHRGNPGMGGGGRYFNTIGSLSPAIAGVPQIDATNKDSVRKRIERNFILRPFDAVVLVTPDGQLDAMELEQLFRKHEMAMGLSAMKIFLSHKGVDKPEVREYKVILEVLGFEPWLDEDDMPPGTKLGRGLLKGFQESCAAVFFITPNFTDEKFLATEIDYAIDEERNRGARGSA